MKKIMTMVIALLAILFNSCSNIADDERLIFVGDVAPVTPENPEVYYRNALIEDFTGQQCTNCPKATEAIHDIIGTFGEERVIPVAIHCGPFGFRGTAKAVGLMTDLGEEYWDKWFVAGQGQPVGKINRGAAIEEFDSWAAVVKNELAKETPVKMELTTSYDEASRELTITTKAVANSDVNGKLQLWLLEDGIVALQKQPDGTLKKEETHNHVLREAVNGSWGEDISLSNTELTKEHKITLNEKYVAENCHVVAFIYNDDGVLQVVRR